MSDDTPPVIRRFADPNATDTVRLPGPCTCPNAPHEGGDTATIRTQYGGGERESIALAGWGRGQVRGFYDYEAAKSELIAAGVKSWTLQDADGEPVAISYDNVQLLDSASREAIATAIDAAMADQIESEQALLPNRSGARSRGSSPASASRTRSRQTRR